MLADKGREGGGYLFNRHRTPQTIRHADHQFLGGDRHDAAPDFAPLAQVPKFEQLHEFGQPPLGGLPRKCQLLVPLLFQYSIVSSF